MDPLAWIATGGAALAALGVTWAKVIVPMWRVIRKIVHFFDDVSGEPARDGVPERPGVMKRLESIEGHLCDHGKRLTAIEHELYPNGGQSLRDVVDRVEQAVVDTETR